MAWTDERRRKQAQAIRRWKPWEKSTGPKSPEGKQAASMNSTTHGATTKAAKAMIREISTLTKNSNKLLEEIKIMLD